jgi:hypothetical protein
MQNLNQFYQLLNNNQSDLNMSGMSSRKNSDLDELNHLPSKSQLTPALFDPEEEGENFHPVKSNGSRGNNKRDASQDDPHRAEPGFLTESTKLNSIQNQSRTFGNSKMIQGTNEVPSKGNETGKFMEFDDFPLKSNKNLQNLSNNRSPVNNAKPMTPFDDMPIKNNKTATNTWDDMPIKGQNNK